ncbi:MAG: hypothetical protein KC438_13995, partial [Thermomicrobiales bacterium]|nr:hypothetical protein [Thermomicrobiales bacterium]
LARCKLHDQIQRGHHPVIGGIDGTGHCANPFSFIEQSFFGTREYRIEFWGRCETPKIRRNQPVLRKSAMTLRRPMANRY